MNKESQMALPFEMPAKNIYPYILKLLCDRDVEDQGPVVQN